MKKFLFLFLMLVAFIGCKNATESKETSRQENDSVAVDTIPHIQRIGVKMTKDGGVYTIPCLVNGIKMNFIFDTGASNVCISLTEALFLYKNGYIDDEDLGEQTQSRVADGSVTTGMKLKLKTIEVGGIVLKDVDAIVSSSLEAPLLLGQSAIQKLGKIEMDGDSLFVTGLVEHPQDSRTNKSTISYTIPPAVPELSWWDKVLAFFGNEDKVEKLCIQAWNAYQNDMPELAISYCDKAIEIREKSWKPYAIKGRIKLEMVKGGKNEEAIALEEFSKALELNEKMQTFYLNDIDSISYQYILEQKCWCEYSNGDTDKALQDAQSGLSLYPQSVRLMNTISISYTKNRHYDLAEKWANKIKNIDAAQGYFRLGYLYKEQGRLSDAAKQYELCISVEPDRGYMVYNNLANIYQDMGFYYRAVDLRKEAARHGIVFSQEWLKEHGYEW